VSSSGSAPIAGGGAAPHVHDDPGPVPAASAEPVVRPHPEPVVLDIGGGFGALVVHWDADRIDTPIEISPAGADADRQHQHILERPTGPVTFHAAVFDRIPAGSYTLWAHDEPRARDVEIADGAVTELDWSAAAA
jgi:hypothetical protein